MAENKKIEFWDLFRDGEGVPDSRIPGHIFFQTERHVAFSPLEEGATLENLTILVTVAKLCRTPEGQKILKDVLVKYLACCSDIVSACQRACIGANAITAIANNNLTAAIAHRLGLIDDGGYIRICDHNTTVTNALIDISVLQNIAGPVTTLVTGSEYHAGAAEGAGGGIDAKGIGSLAAILKGLM